MPLTRGSMVGQTIGNYVVTGFLGEGGMGEVYRAENTRIARKVAIKIVQPLLSVDRSLVERFFDEAKAANLIRHPGIIDVFDFGFFEGRAYLIMELLDGESLGAWLRVLRSIGDDLAMIVSIGAQIACALEAAHRNGIVHRDLKPDNVFLLQPAPGEQELQVKVLDFGVAKLSVDQRANRTASGQMLGTPTYMSPEQCSGAARVDSRADIYALGCILFQMICGHPPFVREGVGDLISAHLTVPAPRPSQLRPGVPPWLDDLVVSMLAKRPEERPQHMAEVEKRLRAGSGAAPTSFPATRPSPSGPTTMSSMARSEPPRQPRRRSDSRTGHASSLRSLAWIAVLGVGAMLVGGAAVLMQRQRPAATDRGLPESPVQTPPPAPRLAPPPVPAAPEPPAPAFVTVSLTGVPPGLSVWVDGRPAELPLRLPAGSGRRELLFRARGYREARVTVDPDRDTVVPLSPLMKPLKTRKPGKVPPTGNRAPADFTGFDEL